MPPALPSGPPAPLLLAAPHTPPPPRHTRRSWLLAVPLALVVGFFLPHPTPAPRVVTHTVTRTVMMPGKTLTHTVVHTRVVRVVIAPATCAMAYYVARGAAPVHEGPSLASRAIAHAHSGAHLCPITGWTAHWVEVRLPDGRLGWVRRARVRTGR